MKLTRHAKILLSLVIAVSIFFRFYGIARIDVQNDHALNSFRAVGYTDYLADANQTAPLNWFGTIPWWSKLSFHDHPPLSFLIQHVFFAIFGDTDLAAFLPFLLAGVASTILVWMILYRATTAAAATAGSLVLALGSYSVWISRSGYLEGLEILAIVGVIFFLQRLLRDENKRNIFAVIACLSAALLIKYTALFLIPFIVISIALCNKNILQRKHFWSAWLLLPCMLLPVGIYNVFVFRSRGHLDAALSSMLGIHTADYQALWSRSINVNFLENFRSIGSIFIHNMPFATTLVCAILLCWGILQILRREASDMTKLATIGTLCSIGIFAVAGAQARFLTISLPFVALLLGMAYSRLECEPRRTQLPFMLIVLIIGISEITYSANTNLVRQPHGTAGIAYAESRFYQRGYHELDQFLRNKVYGQLPERKKIRIIDDAKVGVDESFDNAIIIDERMNWFSHMWYFRRYQFYYDRPIVSLHYILQRMREQSWDGTNVFGYLEAQGANHIWLVTINETKDPIDEKAAVYDRYIESLEKILYEAQTPVQSMHDPFGQVSAQVWDIKL